MSGDVSLYFHIPFCTKKCPYCHFYVTQNSEPLKDLLLGGFEKEWAAVQDKISSHTIVSIYFGGGTPSLFGPKRLERLISLIQKKANVAPDCEITLEANPESVTKDELTAFRHIGINRLSLGVQSFEEDTLLLLGRGHSAKKSLDSVHVATSSGFDNISIDLLYELPRQTVEGWHKTIEEACRLPITHLSLYNLTIEPHTGFFRIQDKLLPLLPSDEDACRMYTDAIDRFASSGFSHYEISAFCRPGFRSRHNIGYWTGRPFWGFGPSAFSFMEKRFQNVCNLKRYTALLDAGKSPIDFVDDVDVLSRRKELLAVGLRMLEGITLSSFEARYGKLADETQDALHKLEHLGLIKRQENRLALTKKGILFYDSVASELI